MGDSSTFLPQIGEFCSNICHEQNLYYNPCVMEMIFCDFHNYISHCVYLLHKAIKQTVFVVCIVQLLKCYIP